VARELPSEIHSAEILQCNGGMQISSVVFGFQFRRGCVRLVFRSLS